MAIRLTDLMGEREVPLGAGVRVTLRPIGFAGMKAAEAAALRQARLRVEGDDLLGARVEQRGPDDEPGAREAREERVAGLAEELLLDAIVMDCVTGWSGVELGDGSGPAPLTPETWAQFRTLVPALADRLRAEIRVPAALVVAEGNG